MKIINCEQTSQEWFDARLGVPSASNFDQIITVKGEPSKQKTKYLYKLAGEKVSGRIEDVYQNGVMLRGVEMEAEARQLYELITGSSVQQVGFCVTEGEAIYGASPDGMVGEHGLIEIKCPLVSTHVGYLLENVLPSDYYQQTQGQLLVTGRKWCDFVSYYPGLKPLIVRVEPDKKFQKALEAELVKFCTELNEVINKIRKD
jgi:putative phage-type endonuclease